MKNKKYLSGKFAYLKSQAEKLIAKDAITMPAKLPENMQEILYELFTHQIELELQNEELRQTQEKLSKSQKNFSDLYDFAPVGYMSISDKGLIVEANLCSADMLAIERGRLIKQSLSNFIVAEDQDLYYLVRKKLLESKKSQTCELRIRRKNESLFDANLKAAISSDIDGSSGQFRIILTDISEQKKKDGLLRKEIEEHQNNKEKLIEAKNIATQANKAKSEFLSSMSHELRTPLNAILGFSQLLQLNNELSSVNKENVQEILSAGNHLLELINDVLDLSIIEAGQIHLSIEAVDVGLMFQECVALVKIMAEKKDIRISHSGTTGIFVRTDYTRLKQVLLNLLSNAIKYNHSGGSIIMSFFVTENQLLRITISDTGMGINSDKMDDLFEPFQRLGAENSAIEGTGIGLTLSKKIVELMGTKINVESKVDVGSTFWFELPIDSSI